MSRGPEGKIQDAVLRYAKSKGLLCKKNEVGRYFVSSGWPDVCFFPDARIPFKGVPFFMEFKAPGKDLTPLQRHQKSELEARGYKVHVVSSKVRGKQIVDEECK